LCLGFNFIYLYKKKIRKRSEKKIKKIEEAKPVFFFI